MRKLALLAVLLMPAQLFAASGQPVIDGVLEPAGFVQLDDLSTAVGLGTIPDGVKLVLIQAEGDDLRWRDDGTPPTDSVGTLLAEGQLFVYNGNPRAIQLIQVTSGGIANVSFYR